jgi:1,4-dihydroxy-2-naphthoyl-CoA synthase
MPYTDIPYDQQGGVATVTLNRPQALNAFRPLRSLGHAAA